MKSVLLVAAGLLLPAGIALAQPPAGGQADARRARHQQEEAQRQQEEARDLSIVLALKPAQQPALATWLASMRPPAGMMHHDRAGGDADAGPTTTPQMLQEKQARSAEMQQFEASRIAATRTFYAALDSRQQQVFDALDRLRHEHRGGHEGGRGPGDHDHGGPGMLPPPPPGA